MFVIDLKEVRKDSNEAEEAIANLVKKSGGEIGRMERWDERRLAYDIKGRDVGLYMLTYFKGGPDVVGKLTRECRLSSAILRSLFFRIREIPDPEAPYSAEPSVSEERPGRSASGEGRGESPPEPDRETPDAEPSTAGAEPVSEEAEPVSEEAEPRTEEDENKKTEESR
jgi:small subunit ribosomal protein S6